MMAAKSAITLATGLVFALVPAGCGGGGDDRTAQPETVTVTSTAETTETPILGAEFGDGTHIIGEDVEPGTYTSEGGSGCYWARLSSFSGELEAIIANDNASGRAVVTIAPTDAGFESSGCGTWYSATDAGESDAAQGHKWPSILLSSWMDGCRSADAPPPITDEVLEMGCNCMADELQRIYPYEEATEPGFTERPRYKAVVDKCVAEALAALGVPGP